MDKKERLDKLINRNIDILCELFNIDKHENDKISPKQVKQQLNSLPRDFDKYLCEVFYKGYDPDSSIIAWAFYRSCYVDANFNNAEINSNYNFNQLHFYNKIYDDKNKTNFYLDSSILKCERLFAFPKDVKAISFNSHKYRFDIYKPTERLSGDTDFNFKTHFYEFSELVDNEIKTLLVKCYNMHHLPVNFSLMQSMGNMQMFKGKHKDRLDSLLYYLDEYYNTNILKRVNATIALNSSKANRNALVNYLNLFEDVYDYCKKIYFIDDKKLIDDLIESGDIPVDSTCRVIEYIELAIRFWEAKSNYFEKHCSNYWKIHI